MDTAAQYAKTPGPALPGWLITGLRYLLAITFPIALALTSVRLVMTETFLQIEYNRPGFPDDRYGFTKENRLKYAPYAVRYLLNDEDISYLGDLTFENGAPLYDERELRHMEDVKVVTRAAFRFHIILGIAYAAAILALAWRSETRHALRWGLFSGGIFTVMLIITLVILMFANWDFFFDGFHGIFFEGDTWLFRTSDTLIRLFPEQFWFDASITIGALTLSGAGSAIWAIWAWEKRIQTKECGAVGDDPNLGAPE
jgi:integral membrane protein (TIGR01906 family)